MSERLDDGKAEKIDKKLEVLKEEAREKIMDIIEKFRDDPNLVINVEEDKETPEVITLELIVSDPLGGETKVYHKGFMKVLKLPNGSTIEEWVEKQIRFPERNIEGA
jgi:hypothetical protein